MAKPATPLRRFLTRLLVVCPLLAGIAFFVNMYRQNTTADPFTAIASAFGAGLLTFITLSLLASPVAEALGTVFSWLLFSTSSVNTPKPQYGHAEVLEKQDAYEEAIEEYRTVARLFRRDAKPYLEMIRIAVVRLRDPDRAQALYREGMQKLRGRAARQTLVRMYPAILSEVSGGRRPPIHLKESARPSPTVTDNQ